MADFTMYHIKVQNGELTFPENMALGSRRTWYDIYSFWDVLAKPTAALAWMEKLGHRTEDGIAILSWTAH